MRGLPALALLALLPLAAAAGELRATGAVVPLAPPGAMVHAAYFTLTNAGAAPRLLVGVRAEGYAAAHLHRSTESGGVVTMSAVAIVEIGPGRSVDFAPGGLHVMLMRPAAPLAEGASVPLVLEFADGTLLQVAATVTARAHGS